MARNYEYWFTRDDEDLSVSLRVVSFSSTKGNFSPRAEDPEEFFGTSEIEWESDQDTSHMTQEEIASMEEWLFNEHSEYLADLEYFD